MCRACEKISREFQDGDLDEGEALAKVAKLMKGKDADHVADLLDEILGTKMEERNADVEEAWEKSYRKDD